MRSTNLQSDSPDPRKDSFAGSLARRRLTWLGLLAVVPLVALLGLQYWWLADLERTSAIARQAELEGYLAKITKDVLKHYKYSSEKVLSLPATLFEPKYVPKLAWYFRKNGTEAAARYFVMNFREEPPRRLLLYDPELREMVAPQEKIDMVAPGDYPPEVWAIYKVTAPWGLVFKTGEEVTETGLLVDERDPEHRMILNLITDESSQLVGIAGLIVDQDHFRTQVLPRAIQESRPAFPRSDELLVSVFDQDNRSVLSPTAKTHDSEVYRAFSFLFTDWHLAARGLTSTSEQWARTNFALNMTLSLALGAVLLGGLLWVLRTASHEMRISEMKNDFVSNVSHELRTPLASIRVFGELLRLGRVPSDGKVREYGEIIETESRRLTQLINNILDFSRIESGRREYDFEPGDLGEIVADALETFEVRLRRSGFRVEAQGLDTELPTLALDRDAIRQALFNLLDNAVKYSGDGRTISVRLKRRRSWAVVEVEDLGIGISRQDRGKIFERFHRVGTQLVHDVKGTGLGLAIVQHIVRAHGGEVRVESELGVGSTFSILLPFSPEGLLAEAEPVPAAEESRFRLQQSS